jgi:hypothetical protein
LVPVSFRVTVRAASVLYAFAASVRAAPATPSWRYTVPPVWAIPPAVYAEVAETPIFPLMGVIPLLLTDAPPKTAKLTAEPSGPANATDGLRRNAANGVMRTIRAAHL